MSIRVITFDLDNTLWDVEPALLRAEDAQRDWLDRHRPGAMSTLGPDQLWELKKAVWKQHPELSHHVSAMRQRFLEELQLRAGYAKAIAEEGAKLAFEVFLAERQRVSLYSDALGVLEALAGRFTLGALTNGNADVYKTDAGEYFDFAFLAEDVGASKPAPDMFEAALAATGVTPEQVLHVGDNPEHDVLGALEVGMRTVWVNARNAPWQHERRPCATIKTLSELPGIIERL